MSELLDFHWTASIENGVHETYILCTATGHSVQQVSSSIATTKHVEKSTDVRSFSDHKLKPKPTLVAKVKSKFGFVKPVSVLKDFDPEKDSVSDMSE